MTLWRLEWLRLIRTKRWIVLLGVFLFFGLVGPFTARYIGEIVSFAGGGAQGISIEFPPPVPADGLAQYSSNAMQLGTLVAVIVASSSLAFDAIPEMGIFLRSRVSEVRTILTPRFVVSTVAVVGSYFVGVVAAWYETWVLIGAPDAGAVMIGAAYGAVFLIFAISLVAAMSGRATSVLGTVISTIVVLLLLQVIGVVEVVGRWLPTHLAGAITALVAGDTSSTHYLGTVSITLVACVVLLWIATKLAEHREL
ncbi:MAG: hypothetical protein M5U23_10305 [Acidimicrobiia bacterium]|nr:hypothetical protein [Acidimicrobiia bacterium]